MKQFVLGSIVLLTVFSSSSWAQIQYMDTGFVDTGYVNSGYVHGGSCQGPGCQGTAVGGPTFNNSLEGSVFDLGPAGVCNHCMQPNCDGRCRKFFRRLGFYGGAVVDVPLQGTFHNAARTSLAAVELGIDPLIAAPATSVELQIDERGFEDIYSHYWGYQANLTYEVDAATKLYVGYREVSGDADEAEIGEAIIDPFGIANDAPLFAQFDDYRETAIQVGFLTSKAWHQHVELLWGGRVAATHVDEIGGTLTVPGIAEVTDIPFYQESDIITFGLNLGLRWNPRPNLSIVAMSGGEFRTSLDQDDSVLEVMGLGNLNNTSGFTSLPVYLGFTLKL